VYYARADGSAIRAAIFPVETPNGIGLSPDGRWLYVAETVTGRLWAYEILEPGVVRLRDSRWARGELLAAPGGLLGFDNLAVQANGGICVATLVDGCVLRVSADGARLEHIPLPDMYVTNLCFGGADLRTAFVTLSSTGRLISVPWAASGLAPNFAGLAS
jgi:gluconolactonase